MVTCKQLMELDIFHNVKLKAGRKGLDRTVSWVYSKHTKTITPWVHGGEFLLVSGYEYGTDESELLLLVEEAVVNNLSGILIEGGINFKEIPSDVICKADEEQMPLFFVNGVISFLDITQDISDLIMENKYLAKKNVSLLEQLLNSSQSSRKEVNQLFYGSGISPDCYFLAAVFNVTTKSEQLKNCTTDRVYNMIGFSRTLQKHTTTLFKSLGLREICKVNLDSVDYLIYGDSEQELMEIANRLKGINTIINAEQTNYTVYLSFSNVIYDYMSILNGLEEAYFTGNLLDKKIFREPDKSFSDLGSYQMMFYVEGKAKLTQFRDQYLKKMYEADKDGSSQLIETLREYLVQGGNVLQTSKKLFIHRNTLQYRMERISAITNMDINDFNVRRDFMNAFMILDVFPFS